MSHKPFVRCAELQVDPAMLDRFRSAAQALREAVASTEPGVAAYHAVSEAEDPARIHVLEVYDDSEAYRQHLRSAPFLAFRSATEGIVTSRCLHDVIAVCFAAKATLTASPLVRIAELEIDPARIEPYEAFVSQEIKQSILAEPGVLALYATALASRPNLYRFFEIYADEAAYRQHLQSPHFRIYAEATHSIVRAKRLLATDAIFLTVRPG